MNAKKIWEVANSSFFLLILAAVLASSLTPKFLHSTEELQKAQAMQAEERRWQYQARENMLLSLNDACCDLLCGLRSPHVYINISDKELEDLTMNATVEMNYAMVRIRLLYGTEFLNIFIQEVDVPLKTFVQEAVNYHLT